MTYVGVKRVTPQLQAVLDLLFTGMTDKEIARALGIALRTVGTYNDRLRFLLGATTRTSMVYRALELGLLRSPGESVSREFGMRLVTRLVPDDEAAYARSPNGGGRRRKPAAEADT